MFQADGVSTGGVLGRNQNLCELSLMMALV